MSMRFHDRTEAGQLLAQRLKEYAHHPDVVVLGLPRGGVPIGFEIAQILAVPLDICLVRKLGVPDHPELAMGAIASGGIRVLNQSIIRELEISPQALAAITRQELQELKRREEIYRGNRPPLAVAGKILIITDDGLATGSTMWAAVMTLRQQHPQQMIIAVPVAPTDVCDELNQRVDQVICLLTPEPFRAIGCWYDDFAQLSDEEVCNWLNT
jgi:putative phosphoribosyl transferase